MGGGSIDPDGVASSRIVSVLAFIIFRTPLKIQNDVFWYRPTRIVQDKVS